MTRKLLPIHPSIRSTLDVPDTISDRQLLAQWKLMSRRVCKPCWELRYCPYGPMVEDSPLLPVTLTAAEDHNLYLINCLEGGVTPDGKALSRARRKLFRDMVAEFRPEEHPLKIPRPLAEMQCTVFGHLCPVMFAAEGFTETSAARRIGRYIPFQMKMRVVRRDNYTCQHCGKNLKDDEVEFDHIIPVARGGSAEEHNIRLTCFDCNRDKSDHVEI